MEMTLIDNAPEMTLRISRPWPEPGMLDAGDFAGTLSSLQVDAMIAGSDLSVRVGDSRNVVYLHGQLEKGQEGLEQMKVMALVFVDAIRRSVPAMSGDYAAFYESILDDFDTNGFVMPRVGKLI